MVRIILMSMFISMTACSESKICDPEFPGRCHTKAEWDKISEENLKSIACLDKAEVKLRGQRLKGEALLEAMYKECNVRETTRFYQ